MGKILLFLPGILVFSCAKEDATIPLEASESNFLGEIQWPQNFGSAPLEVRV